VTCSILLRPWIAATVLDASFLYISSCRATQVFVVWLHWHRKWKTARDGRLSVREKGGEEGRGLEATRWSDFQTPPGCGCSRPGTRPWPHLVAPEVCIDFPVFRETSTYLLNSRRWVHSQKVIGPALEYGSHLSHVPRLLSKRQWRKAVFSVHSEGSQGGGNSSENGCLEL
jgi:hypothetical protein